MSQIQRFMEYYGLIQIIEFTVFNVFEKFRAGVIVSTVYVFLHIGVQTPCMRVTCHSCQLVINGVSLIRGVGDLMVCRTRADCSSGR